MKSRNHYAYMKRDDKKGTVASGRIETPKEVLTREHWDGDLPQTQRPYLRPAPDPEFRLKAMSRTPGRIKWVCRPIGADNEFIYHRYLGVGPGKLKELKQAGVI